MDFFQGSTPPSFIPFRLENVLEEDVQTPDPTSVRTPDNPTNQALNTNESGLQTSPLSVDSETDVNVFAETMVRIMDKVHSPIQEEPSLLIPLMNSHPRTKNLGKILLHLMFAIARVLVCLNSKLDKEMQVPRPLRPTSKVLQHPGPN